MQGWAGFVCKLGIPIKYKLLDDVNEPHRVVNENKSCERTL